MEELIVTNQPTLQFLRKSTSFLYNTGTSFRLSDVILMGNDNTEFSYNRAQSGAALYLIDS